MASITCALFWAICPLLIALAAIAWIIEPQSQRIRRWHRSGHSQRAIAARLNISRRQVRRALAG